MTDVKSCDLKLLHKNMKETVAVTKCRYVEYHKQYSSKCLEEVL